MKSLLGLLLFASVASAATNDFFLQNTFKIFNSYAGSRKESELKALEQFKDENGRLSFCTSFGNCMKKDGKMVEGQLKVFTCEKWEEHAIPSFIRENDVIEIIKRDGDCFENVGDNMKSHKWTLVQNITNNRVDCDAIYSFTNSHTKAILSSVELICTQCQFDEFLPKYLRDMMCYDIELNIQNYISPQEKRPLFHLKEFLRQFYTTLDEYQQPWWEYRFEIRCANSTNGTKFEKDGFLSEPILKPWFNKEELHGPKFLRGQNLVNITTAQDYKWKKINEERFLIEDQWKLNQKDRTFDCTTSVLFDTEFPGSPRIYKFSIDCDYCVALHI